MSISPREPQNPHVVLVYDTEHVKQVFGPYDGQDAATKALEHLRTWPTLQDPAWQWDVQPCHQIHPPNTQPRPHLRGVNTVNVPDGAVAVGGILPQR